ncbi:MAG: universal stress protein [Taibaiella sp.]|nr:universal stress protein [Taibaiella sp.]
MKNLLVATDFSDCARNALNYAISLAKEKQCHIILMHANDLTVYGDGISPMEGNVKLASQKISEESLEKEVERVQGQLDTVQVTSEFFVGDIVAGLQERAQQGDIWLTIMGTTGQNSSGLFWGSKSMNAMRSHTGPILLVPPQSSYQDVDRMMLCMDIHANNERFPFAEVKGWVQEMHASLDILNVQPLDPFDEEDENEHLKPFEGISYSFHSMESEQLRDAITFYLDKHGSDWLIVIPKKYNFFESLFHRSKSEVISKASNVPVLALHTS